MSTDKYEMKVLNADDRYDTSTPKARKNKSCCPIADRMQARYILAALFFFGIVALTPTRHGFSFAIVVMNNSTSTAKAGNQTALYQQCPSRNSGNVSSKASQGDRDQAEFEWGESMKGTLLSAYFYGYVSTQLVGGLLEQKLGGKIVFGTSLMLAAVLNTLSPVAARSGPWSLFAVRFCIGLATGVFLPTTYGVWGRWAPPTERSRLLAVCYVALYLGSTINFPLASSIADAFGWPAVFYIPGSFIAVWLVAWVFLAYDSPAKHPRILEKEQKYIEDSIGVKFQQRPPVPWMKVLTSLPVWALVIGQFSVLWGQYVLLTQLPNYMKNVLGFNIKTNGLLSALPSVMSMISMLVSGFLADYLIKRRTIAKVWIRRGFVITGFTGIVICGIVLANLSGCDPVAAVTLFCLLRAFTDVAKTGFNAVHVEFAPSFSGVTFALANTAGNLCGIFAPQMVGVVLESDPTISGWSKVFYIGAAIQGLGCIFTVVFMRTDVQPWARGKDDDEIKNTWPTEQRNIQVSADDDRLLEATKV